MLSQPEQGNTAKKANMEVDEKTHPPMETIDGQHLTKTILKEKLIQRSIYTHKLPWGPVMAQHMKKMYLQNQAQ